MAPEVSLCAKSPYTPIVDHEPLPPPSEIKPAAPEPNVVQTRSRRRVRWRAPIKAPVVVYIPEQLVVKEEPVLASPPIIRAAVAIAAAVIPIITQAAAVQHSSVSGAVQTSLSVRSPKEQPNPLDYEFEVGFEVSSKPWSLEVEVDMSSPLSSSSSIPVSPFSFGLLISTKPAPL